MSQSASGGGPPDWQTLSGCFRQAQEQVPGALQQLLALYRPLLLKIAQQKLGERVRAKVAPSDIVQSTIWAVTREFTTQQFADRQGFFAWMITILKHTAENERRRYQGTQKRNIFREQSLRSPETQQQLTQLSQTLSGEFGSTAKVLPNVDRMVEALELLPPHYQLVIQLRYFERLPFEAIGKKFGRSPDAVRALHKRVLAKLRKILLDVDEGTPDV